LGLGHKLAYQKINIGVLVGVPGLEPGTHRL
jgi:hypothetical protein